jgi:hypothetical protein
VQARGVQRAAEHLLRELLHQVQLVRLLSAMIMIIIIITTTRIVMTWCWPTGPSGWVAKKRNGELR